MNGKTSHTLSRTAIDMTGRRIGLLTIIRRAGSKGKLAQWECQCDCGKVVIRVGARLRCRPGRYTSCGCKTSIRHGGHKTPEYYTWTSMLHRCSNPQSAFYSRYGGRGITVCKEWQSFEAFIRDMGHRPSSAHSLDRINNDGNYEPKNCRWATTKQQAFSRSTTKPITFNGETLMLTEWAARYGMNPETLRNRVRRAGWSFEKAISTPNRRAAV